MNMKLGFLVLALLCCLQTIGFAQKVKLDKKTDVISIDGVNVLKVERKPRFDLSIQDLEGKEIAYLVFQEYKDTKEISKSNPTGRITYFELAFEDIEGMTEVSFGGAKKGVVKFLLKNELIDLTGTVQKEAIPKFMERNGQKYSRKRDELK